MADVGKAIIYARGGVLDAGDRMIFERRESICEC